MSMLGKCRGLGLVFFLLQGLAADVLDSEIEDYCNFCTCSNDGAVVDCSSRGLTDLPEGIKYEVKLLNLSNNEIETMPKLQGLFMLTTLDLSDNLMKAIPSDALNNLTELETLNLSHNLFTSWVEINPNTFLLPAVKLKELDLSKNEFQTFGDLKDEEYLISPTIETLILEECGIQTIQEKSPISGLTAIKILRLRKNPLHRLQNLVSPTLEELDLSFCEINYIPHGELAYLPSLVKLHMSHNYRLLITTYLGNLSSDSLKEIDISYCNVNQVGLSGFPNLRRANLTGNMIRTLNTNDFYNNTRLQVLDLSYNSITSLRSNCFRGLISLKYLNLTANMISEIPEDTFMRTIILTSLSLSRNYLTKLGHIQSGTLLDLDISMCEIDTIDKDSLEGMWSLKYLNLSRNLLSSLPDSLSSDTLMSLDLSSNRLSTINNNTFYMLPRLMVLSVSGNRFSATWKRSFFNSNRYLERLDMSDNTWRCECSDAEMFEFYEYLTLEPNKLEESSNLVCHSPSNVTDMTWQEACDSIWFPSTQATLNNDTILLFLTVVIVSFLFCALVVMIVRRMLHAKMELIRQERERQAEEARERLRRIRLQHEQQAQCNAPDPRDLISPPSYDEALLMPRPVSMHSLNELSNKKRKKGRRRAKSSGDLVEDQRNGTAVDIDRDDLTDDESRRERRTTRRNRRYGSHELKELERSPRARRRRASEDNVDGTEIVEVAAEVERLMRDSERNGVGNGDVRESDF